MGPGVIDDVVNILFREDGHEIARKTADILLKSEISLRIFFENPQFKYKYINIKSSTKRFEIILTNYLCCELKRNFYKLRRRCGIMVSIIF